MSLFPSVITTYSTKVNGQIIDASDVNNLQTDVSQIEQVLGVAGASSVVGTYEYIVKSPASNGGGHVQTANKGGTGQTTFNKGDILVAQSTSVLTKLSASTTDGYALITDSAQNVGLRWGVPNSKPTVRVYSTPSTLTWVKPSVLAYVVVEVQGGGAAGGAAGNSDSAGGGGGYSRKVIAASLLGANESVVIGIAGQPNGSVAGKSYFGTASYLVGQGGTAGAGSNNAGAAGGAGGAASGGDINIVGGSGPASFYIGGAINQGLQPLVGGVTPFGSNSYGSGGGADTAGTAGIVIVTEF